MKKKILLLMGVFSFGLLTAQVGINTQNPLGVFHLDGKNNTPVGGASNVIDDVVITDAGNVGIGTVTPQARLDLQGTLRIADGTQALDYIFTAQNGAGKAKWAAPNLSAKVGEWYISNPGLDCYASYSKITLKDANPSGPSYLDNSQIALSATDNTYLTIPAGKYLVFINQDIAAAEYGIFGISNASDGSTVYQQYYAEWLAGACFMLNIATSLKVYVTWQPYSKDMAALSNGYYNAVASGKSHVILGCRLTFLSLI